MARLAMLICAVLLLLASPATAEEPTEDREGGATEPAESPKKRTKEPDPLAIAYKVEGKVTLRRSKAGDRALVAHDLLIAGDSLSPDAHCKATLFLRDGSRRMVRSLYTLDEGQLKDGVTSKSFQQLLEKIKRAKESRGRNAGAHVVRGSGVALGIEPRGWILTDTPRFVWESAAPDLYHRLRVFRDEGEDLSEVLSVVLDGRATSAQVGHTPLAPGIYAWHIETVPMDEERAKHQVSSIPSATAWFRVVTPEVRERIESERSALEAELPGDDESLRHVLLASFWVKDQTYCLDYARKELERALMLDPEDEGAKDLMRYVRILLGLPTRPDPEPAPKADQDEPEDG